MTGPGYPSGEQEPGHQPPHGNPQQPPYYPPPPPSYPPPPMGGYPPPQPYPPGYGDPYAAPYGNTQPHTNGLAIGSLVASLVGVPLAFFCFIGGIGSIAGIVLGIIALNQIKQNGEQGRGMAIAGIAVGAATVMLFIILFAIGFGLGAVNYHSTY